MCFKKAIIFLFLNRAVALNDKLGEKKKDRPNDVIILLFPSRALSPYSAIPNDFVTPKKEGEHCLS